MRATLVLCVSVAACSSPPAAPTGSWHVELSGQRATLLSVWGTSPRDVFTVGGPLGDGTPSAMLHFDGQTWQDLMPGGTETFWWTHGTGPDDVWAVGERGRISHWNGTHLTEVAPRPTTATLYGVWAAAPNDVWAVGGTPEGGTTAPNDVVLHFDGSAWSQGSGPPAQGRAFFKVWGSSAADVYVVGEAATIWHRRAGSWVLESNPPLASGTLLTVAGCSASEVYAVGNSDVLRSDGTRWTRVAVMDVGNGVNGVSCAMAGSPVIVGYGGLKQRLVSGHWQDDFGQDPHQDLHGAWADGTGGFWAAGGDFVTDARDGGFRGGLLAHFGP
jgi:hypothetical protein